MTGYVLKMFPRFSETFILTEILEMERRNRGIHIISLKRPNDGRFHENLSHVRATVRYIPDHVRCDSLRFFRAHLRAIIAHPRAYLKCFLRAACHPGAWKAFFRAPLVAEEARSAGCRRLHAHFASLPAVTAMFAAELVGIPFSFTAHAKDIFLDGLPKRLLKTLILKARKVITVSDFNVNYLSDLVGPSLPQDRIIRIYNGIDLETFRYEPERPGKDAPLILAVGRLVEKKGFVDLLAACAILRDQGVRFRCEIIGKGPLQEELARRITEWKLGNLVRLTGPLPRGEVARRLRQAAVMAVPCVIGHDGNRDGLPTVILESMASGRTVVATRVTGIPEAVEDQVTGRTVEPGNPRAFASALAELLGDPDFRSLLGLAARRRAERVFDIGRNVAMLEAVLRGESTPNPILPFRRIKPSSPENRGVHPEEIQV